MVRTGSPLFSYNTPHPAQPDLGLLNPMAPLDSVVGCQSSHFSSIGRALFRKQEDTSSNLVGGS